MGVKSIVILSRENGRQRCADLAACGRGPAVFLSREDGEGSPASSAGLVHRWGSFAVYAAQDDRRVGVRS